jgi:hypothetical protein
MSKTDFEYGTLITPEFLDLLFFKDYGSGKRGLQFDGLDEDGHLPQIVTEFLADNSVNNAKLANASVSTSKIQDGALSTQKIADNAVSNSKIADTAVNTRTLADGSVTGPKIGQEAVQGVNISSGAINVPLKKTPNASANLYLAYSNFAMNLNASNELTLSNIVRQSLVTNPTTADFNESLDTIFKEFQFGSLVNQGVWDSIYSAKFTSSIDTGINFDSTTIVMAQATAKTIVVSGFSYPKGVLFYSTSNPAPRLSVTGGVQTTYNNSVGGEFGEPVGRLYFTKHPTNGNIVANLDLYGTNQVARRTLSAYSFRLLMAYRPN